MSDCLSDESRGRLLGLAHSRNHSGDWHALHDHLVAVGALAGDFATAFGANRAARQAGLWHDIGKATSTFREYLIKQDAKPDATERGSVGHKMAGAVLAARNNRADLAFVIAGHHGGLHDFSKLQGHLATSAEDPLVAEALQAAELVDCLTYPTAGTPWVREKSASARRRQDIEIRMLFSALVDADFLDTESHFSAERATIRGVMNRSDPDRLSRSFGESRDRTLAGRKADRVASDRTDLFDQLLAKASLAPGIYTLTAPTGSGKTLSSLAFAIEHARANGLRRIVLAAPFVSITEQSASVYRQALGDDVVLEHHSSVEERDDESFSSGAYARRLAAENWDASVVVTTTVRLLESLFSNRTGACRKLHRLAQSVILIDESQSIPFGLLDASFDMLRTLVEVYGASVVLITATQPPFALLPSAEDAQLHELIDDADEWFERFRRVTIEPHIDPMSWEAVADLVAREAGLNNGQCIVVVNTINDAATLSGNLSGLPGLTHLSTRLCPTHRRTVLADVRRRLARGEPCILVSTQVVEAGVDVSFPVGLRAIGPAPAIAQVAGRVNRHGDTDEARLIVFNPEAGKTPPGDYAIGSRLTLSMFAEGVDVLSKAGIDSYYHRLIDAMGKLVDERDIQRKRQNLEFEQVAERYRLITDDTVGVVVGWPGSADAIDDARRAKGRHAMRLLQPFTVNLRRSLYNDAKALGLVRPIIGVDLAEEWSGSYDPILGLQVGSVDVCW